MKNYILTPIILLALSLSLTAQNDKEIKAELKHVTVYPDRAQLNHESSFDLGSGKTTLKLKGLSPYIDAQSIQVKGTGEFTILSVNLQNNFIQNLEDSPEVKNIRSQIEQLQAKVEDENIALKTLKQKEDFLFANREVLVKATNFSIDQFKTLLDIYTGNVDLVNTAVLKKNRLIKDYEKQIAALQ